MTRIVSDGIPDLNNYLRLLPGRVLRAARIAINEVAEGSAIKQARTRAYAENAFPKGYLDGPRLSVTQRATENRLEAQIVGRRRQTSLARFADGFQSPESTRRTGGVRVTVNPGQPEQIKRGFLLRLNRGGSQTRDNFNLGLAIRLRPGEAVKGRRNGTKYQIFPDVYLLYAPSVDQVFRDVAADIAPDVADAVGVEFRRQFALETKGVSRGR